MSHFTRVETKINDLKALFKALADLDRPYTVGSEACPATVHGYVAPIAAEISVKFPGTEYELGFVRGADGSYEMVADWWGLETTLGRTQGEIVEELTQAYGVAKVTLACEEAGYAFDGKPQRQADGSLLLNAVRWG